jgi:hypothetical protein
MYPDTAEQGTTTTQTVIMGVAPTNKGYVPPSHLYHVLFSFRRIDRFDEVVI